MATNVEVNRNNNESSANVIRRFTKRVQGAGHLPRLRSERYHQREKSRNVRREARLKKVAKAAEYEQLVKLGKIQEFKRRR